MRLPVNEKVTGCITFSPKRVAEWKEFSTKHNTQLAKAAWQSKWSALSATSAMMCYGCAMVPVCDTPTRSNKIVQGVWCKIQTFQNYRSGMTFGLKSQTGKKTRVKVQLRNFIARTLYLISLDDTHMLLYGLKLLERSIFQGNFETQQLPPAIWIRSTPKRLIKDRAYVPHDALYERRVGVARRAIHLHDARNGGSPHPQCSFWFSKPALLKVQKLFHVWTIG